MFEFQPQRIKELKAGRAQLGDGAQFLYDMMAKNFDWDDVVYTPPTRTFSERLDLKVGNKDVQLIYAGPAHTRAIRWSMSRRTRPYSPAICCLSVGIR